MGVFHKQRGLMLSPDDFWVLSGNNPLTTCVAGIKASISVPGACRHLTISVRDINACRHLLGCQLPRGEDVYIFDAARHVELDSHRQVNSDTYDYKEKYIGRILTKD